MNIIQITPGAGKMFCGGCFRDNALVAALRKLGHSVTMLPLYLPLTLESEDQSGETPVFFGGINVYLEQKFPLFQIAPDWLRRTLASPSLLKAAAGSTAKTNPEDVGDIMLSMLRGEEGNQRRELDELISWLKANEKPDVISLSNVLLAGLARKMKAELRVPVVCSLQGEDAFLDALPEKFRAQAWKTLSERAADIDLFISPSRYFADLMAERLKVPRERIKVVYNGIDLSGFESRPPGGKQEPTVGFFARMCREKGLDTLVDAYVLSRSRGRHLKLKVAGSCSAVDEVFVNEQRDKLKAAGFLDDAEFHPNVSREQKISFLQSLTVFSVPAMYGEAFGLYLIEALAAGVPVVQPRHAAFPELIEATGGGILCEPNDAKSLADKIDLLLQQPETARALGIAGRTIVWEKFNAEIMARNFVQAIGER